MRKIIVITLFITLTSCAQQGSSERDFIDKLLDLQTATSNKEYVSEEYIQLTNLYDSLAFSIPDDKDEKLILVERLKERGFEIADWGRGNFPPLGPRIVIVEVKKGNCTCEVSKIYYATVADTAWQRAEGINCKR